MKVVGVFGATGKMGREVVELLRERKIKVEIFSRNDAQKASLLKAKVCDVIIDFSSPEALMQALEIVVKSGTPLVSGTTGMTEKQEKKLALAAKKTPILWAPNMSRGVAALKKALEVFAPLVGFDFHIKEIHHKNKKDSPSGTAKALQKKLQSVVGPKIKLPEPISVREGEALGTHTVFAVSEYEQIVFEHQALTRKVFAEGAIQCAKWLVKAKPGLYSMEDTLNVRK